MPPDNYFGPDFPTKQSAGYMFVRLLSVQLLFIAVDALLVLIGDTGSSVVTFPGLLYISPLDIVLILIGLLMNFAIFISIFARWQSIEYRVSTTHLSIERGFLNYRAESIIDLSAISRALARRNWLGSLFNYGTVEIFLDTHHQKRSINLYGIPYPYQFVAYLNAQLLLEKSRDSTRQE
jgi:uncharacterized membrane protein YdbT with pleckstrin-like domain